MKNAICISCILTLMSWHVTEAVQTYIVCDGSHLYHELDQIYSLDVLLNNASAAHLNTDGVQNECEEGRRCVSNVSGVIGRNNVYLQGSVDLICGIDQVICEVYGYDIDISDFRKIHFPPTLEYDVGITNKKVTKQTLHPSEEVLLICSVTVGSNTTQMNWRTQLPGGNYTHVLPEIPVHFAYSNTCHIQITKYIIYDPIKGGKETLFHCFYGDVEVGSLAVDVNDEGNLPIHLFLSSFLVYLHFVIMPTVCSTRCIARTGLVERYRDPDNEKMRLLRGSVSLLVAVAFIIWWIAVLHSYGCYFYFFLIETFFLVLYGIIRLLSHQFEKPGDRHLYNGRVALSCGAVIIPTVSWVMIKVQQDISTSPLEGFWWIVTLLSLSAFISVSQDREMKAWEKKP